MRLNLTDEAAVREAFLQVEAAARQQRGAGFIGCSVPAMIADEAERMIGTSHHHHGPLVLLDTGGTLAERLKDMQLLAAPPRLRSGRCVR